MTLWTWIVTGLAGLLMLSVFLGVAIARILGKIGEEVTELLEAVPWASAPLTREAKASAAAREIESGADAHDRRPYSSRT